MTLMIPFVPETPRYLISHGIWEEVVRPEESVSTAEVGLRASVHLDQMQRDLGTSCVRTESDGREKLLDRFEGQLEQHVESFILSLLQASYLNCVADSVCLFREAPGTFRSQIPMSSHFTSCSLHLSHPCTDQT